MRQNIFSYLLTSRYIPSLSSKYALNPLFLKLAVVVRTIGFLGFIANVIALSSLIYGAFQEPLGPYMQDIMGGVLQAYASVRDAIFETLGSALTTMTNGLKNYFSWLPWAPWFTLSSIGRDVIVMYALGGSAAFRTMQDLMREKYGPSNWNWILRVLRDAVFWPIAMSSHLLRWFSGSKVAERSHTGFIRFYKQLVLVLIGSVVFFLLVFAENIFGL